MFSCEFCKISKNTSGRLLLKILLFQIHICIVGLGRAWYPLFFINTTLFLWITCSMMARETQAVFVNDSYFKSEFHFHVQFEF